MPESELSKKVIKAIKAADKLKRDVVKDSQELVEALRKLKEIGRDEDKPEAKQS